MFFPPVGQPAQACPDHAVGEAATVARADVTLRQRQIESRPLRVTLLVIEQPVCKHFVGADAGLKGKGVHDQDSMNQFIAVVFVVVLDRIELLRSEENPVHIRTKSDFRFGRCHRQSNLLRGRCHYRDAPDAFRQRQSEPRPRVDPFLLTACQLGPVPLVFLG